MDGHLLSMPFHMYMYPKQLRVKCVFYMQTKRTTHTNVNILTHTHIIQ